MTTCAHLDLSLISPRREKVFEILPTRSINDDHQTLWDPQSPGGRCGDQGMPRDTRTGGVLENMVLPALRRGGYRHRKQVVIGRRLGGRNQKVAVLAWKVESEQIPISFEMATDIRHRGTKDPVRDPMSSRSSAYEWWQVQEGVPCPRRRRVDSAGVPC
jgi:hypothetical protein